MSSLILQIAARHLLPLLLFASVVFLFRGHDHPGGGFIGGLLAVEAFLLILIAGKAADARRKLRVDPRNLLGSGLLAALASGAPAFMGGKPAMTGIWINIKVPLSENGLNLGTPLMFDIGVYLVVTGAILTIVFALVED